MFGKIFARKRSDNNKPKPSFKKRFLLFVVKLLLLLIVIGVLPFTPVFSWLGVHFLSFFSVMTLPKNDKSPQSIVVLGGGLTKQTNQDGSKIILNHYSKLRANSAYQLHQQTKLPIITSGAESPWLSDYLKTSKLYSFMISDNASMNTCENAIFTAKLLKYHELSNSIYLVTDRYHMARARRQFAKAGVQTYPYEAPLVLPLDWRKPKNNLMHSRRVVYEVAALVRDIVRPQNNCRNEEFISIEEISTPRRVPKIF